MFLHQHQLRKRLAFNATSEPLPAGRNGRYLKRLKRDYLALLDDRACGEQTVQDFLEQHSVVWCPAVLFRLRGLNAWQSAAEVNLDA